MNTDKSMSKNIMWNTVGSVFYCVCQWLITVLVVRMDSFEASGYLSLAMTTSSSFSAISLFSMRNFQVSDVRGEYSSGEYVGSRMLTSIVAFFSCVIVVMCSKQGAYQWVCTGAFMLIRVAEALVDVLHGLNQKYDRYDLIGKSYILRGIITIGAFVTGMIISKDLLITLILMAILNLSAAIIYDWLNANQLEHIYPVIFKKKVFQLLKTCIPIVAFSFLLSLENLMPKTVLQNLAGTEQLGIYSSIASPTLVVQVFASVAFNPLLPGFSLVFQDRDMNRFRNMFHKVILGLLLMSAVVTAGAIILGQWGLNLLFGEVILQYYDLFMPIVWVTILTAMIWILSSIVVAMRRIKSLLIGMIADFVLCVTITTPLIEKFEKNGISIVQIITLSLYIIYMVILCEITIIHEKEREK